ncbi:MAG TPA: glycosyltransferase family 4 protein [Amycolatopsis sp.]|jgi:glycosyltransferase involved in cell wall biosynthesis|nr:glycosyltransferase family 4 protein [Amycolatopsis sp.]
MRIAVVDDLFPPGEEAARMPTALARRYAAEGHDVLVLGAARRGARGEDGRDGFRVVRLPAIAARRTGPSGGFDLSLRALLPGNKRRVARLLGEFRPDVLHLHGQFSDLSWLAGRYAREHRVPTLFSINAFNVRDKKFCAMLLRLLDAFVVKRILARLDARFVAGDKQGLAHCARRYGIADQDVECFPIAVDAGRYDLPPTRNIRAEQAIGDGPLIVSMGHVVPSRNRLPLVEAMPAILDRHPRTRVLVVGAVYDDSFVERAEELGVRHALSVRGAVPKEDIPAYFAAADIVAQDLNGGCGTASLAAMLSATPTIVSVGEDNFPGIVLRDGVNMLLVPPDNAEAVAATVLDLLADPARAAWIARRQSETARRHFTLGVVADRHLLALEKLVAGNAFRP